MHYPLTDIHAHFEINRPVRYRNTTKRNYFHRRTDGRADGRTDGRTNVAHDNNRWFFSKKEKNTKNKASSVIQRIAYPISGYMSDSRS